MQNRYVGDIGDFAKYGLLPALTGSDLRLGVVWYLNPDEEVTGDGQLTAYSRIRSLNPGLFDALEKIRRGNRCVQAVEAGGILPGATFYSESLDFRSLPALSRRIEARARWTKGLFDAMP